MNQVFKASCVAVLLSALITVAAYISEVVLNPPLNTGVVFQISFIAAGMVAVVVAMIIIFYALPVHFLLVRLGLKRYVWYFLVAMIPTSLLIYILGPLFGDTDGSINFLVIFCYLIAIVSSTSFWFVAVYKTESSNGSVTNSP